MPFVKIDPSVGRPTNTDAVGMSALKASDGKVTLSIYIGVQVCIDSGISPGDKLSFLEGVDQDAGSFLLEVSKDKTGYKLYDSKGAASHSLRVLVARLRYYYVAEPPQLYTALDFTADKASGILVRMPTWMHYRQPQSADTIRRILSR
jgi:hypothetical protein